jgi:hypothetical protein
MSDAGRGLQPCPRCGSSDLSQSVAAIVAGQTHVVHGSQRVVGAAWTPSGLVPVAAGGSFGSTQQTELARMLDLPAPHPPSSKTGCLAAVLLVLGVFMGGFVVWAVLAGETTDGNADGGQTQQGEASDALTAAIGGFFFGGAPLIAGTVMALNSRQARHRWRRDSANWRRAAPIAARLVYCGRDHVVYDPAGPEVWLHPTQTSGYVYQRALDEQSP